MAGKHHGAKARRGDVAAAESASGTREEDDDVDADKRVPLVGDCAGERESGAARQLGRCEAWAGRLKREGSGPRGEENGPQRRSAGAAGPNAEEKREQAGLREKAGLRARLREGVFSIFLFPFFNPNSNMIQIKFKYSFQYTFQFK